MKNKQLQIAFRRLVLGVLFIIFGAAILFFTELNPERETLSFFFLFVGGLSFMHSCLSYLRYKKTGEIKPVLDERLELNNLKASRTGFLVVIYLLSALIILKAFEVIDETMFVGLIPPALAISILVYTAFFLYSERRL